MQPAVTPASPAAEWAPRWHFCCHHGLRLGGRAVGRRRRWVELFELNAEFIAALLQGLAQIAGLVDVIGNRLPGLLRLVLPQFWMQQPGRQAGATVFDAPPVQTELVLGAGEGHVAQAQPFLPSLQARFQ